VKATLATLGALIVSAGVVLGGWSAGWWFTEQNVNREFQVNTHSQGYVQAEVDHLRDLAEGYRATAVPEQQASIRDEFCALYVDLAQAAPADLTADAARLGC